MTRPDPSNSTAGAPRAVSLAARVVSLAPRTGPLAPRTVLATRAVSLATRAAFAVAVGGGLLSGALVSTAATAWPLAAQEGIALPVGTPAPDATVEDLEGAAVSLLDVAGVTGGRPALIEFWASWCEQCEALQPQLDAVRERWAGQVGVVAVAVAVAQSRRRVRRHVERHSPGYPYVYDASGEAVRAYQALTTSIVVLVDGDGRVAYAGTGPEQDLVGAVEAMIGGA